MGQCLMEHCNETRRVGHVLDVTTAIPNLVTLQARPTFPAECVMSGMMENC
jgi:hypothetical protein